MLSDSQHLEFISEINTNIHTSSCAKTGKHITRSPVSEISQTISCLLWQDEGDRSLEMTFLPADCKDLYVTTGHLPKAGAGGEERGEEIEIRRAAALLPSSISVDISSSVLYHVQMRFWKSATEIVVLKPSCGKQIWMCFFFSSCSGFSSQTWMVPDILYKWQACACAHGHTNPVMNQGIEIKTSNCLFHLVCLGFFHLVFIPAAELCILFCNHLCF